MVGGGQTSFPTKTNQLYSTLCSLNVEREKALQTHRHRLALSRRKRTKLACLDRGGGIGPADPAAAGPIILVAKNITN